MRTDRSPGEITLRFKHTLRSSNKAFTLDLDLSLPSDGITVIFGHSGSGKSTFLRCCAGLEKSNNLEFRFNGHQWSDASHTLPVQKRQLGFVFQDNRLFPNLTVFQNLVFARKRSWKPIEETFFRECLDVFELQPLLHQTTQNLSGGELQRCNIVRALLMQGQLLLLDEPLSGLDSQLKRRIMQFLSAHLAKTGASAFYVTHSINELAQLADHVMVLEDGKCIAHGHYQSVLGDLSLSGYFQQNASTVIETELLTYDAQYNMSKVGFSGGHLWLSGQSSSLHNRVQIFASDVSLSKTHSQQTSILNHIPCYITHIDVREEASHVMVGLCAGRDIILAKLTLKSHAELNIAIGDKVWAQIKSVALTR